MRPEARSLRRAASDLSQCVSLCKHSNLLVYGEVVNLSVTYHYATYLNS